MEGPSTGLHVRRRTLGATHSHTFGGTGNAAGTGVVRGALNVLLCLAPWSESRQRAATEEHNILHSFTSLFSPAEDGAELELGTATRCGIENAGASAYRANLPPQGGGASDARRWAFSVSPVKEVIVCVIGLFIMRMGPGSLPAAALPQALEESIAFSLCAAARNRVGRVTTYKPLIDTGTHPEASSRGRRKVPLGRLDDKAVPPLVRRRCPACPQAGVSGAASTMFLELSGTEIKLVYRADRES